MSDEQQTTATADPPRGAESASAAGEQAAPTPQPAPQPDPPKGGYWWGTGRRKTSTVRVRIRPGEGTFKVNGRDMDEYFTEPQHQQACRKPLKAGEMDGKMDVFVNARGGGFKGQAEAVMLGLARALKSYDPTLEDRLRDQGLLSRDPREVERKKYGQRGARRQFQFSKR